MPSVQSKRAAGFGYGNKYDLTKMAMKSPAPNKYNIKDSSFDESKIKHKGYSFGLGREVCFISSIFLFNLHNSLKIKKKKNNANENTFAGYLNFYYLYTIFRT